jgi:hypothetical protein
MHKFLLFLTISTISLYCFGQINTTGELLPSNFISHLEFKGEVISEPNHHIWCSSPIRDKKGNIHVFASRWETKYQFDPGWARNCEIVQYVSKSPEGPFVYKRTILKGSPENANWMRFAPHNPTIVKVGKKYALLFIANNGYKEEGFPANQRIGMAITDDLNGEFKLVENDGLILSPPSDSTIWCYNSKVGVNNPTLLQHPDGRFFLYFKAMVKNQPRRMGVAISSQLEGPYQIQPKPLTDNKGTIEDGIAFMLKDTICLLCTDCYGDFDNGGGQLWTSTNGINFNSKPYPGYHNLSYYTVVDKKNVTNYWSYCGLQRPALLLEKNGLPSYLYTACGTNLKKGNGSVVYLFKIK